MDTEKFFYWFGVGSFILALPIAVVIVALAPAAAMALLFGKLNEAVEYMDRNWWNSKEEYMEAREEGTWRFHATHKTAHFGVWVEEMLDGYIALLAAIRNQISVVEP